MTEGSVLVSSCLLGVRCRYDGSANPSDAAGRLETAGRAVSSCPEMLGGLPSPRARAEIVGGDGGDVLDGRARVLTDDGRDVTAIFLSGARAALGQALARDVRSALLKSKSPSCGAGAIADGTFSGSKRSGDGVTAALLKRNGITVETSG